MVYGIGQGPLNTSTLHAALGGGETFAQLDAQWRQWAKEGFIGECRGVALERLQVCMAQKSPCLDLSDLFLTSLLDRLPEHVAVLNLAGNRLVSAGPFTQWTEDARGQRQRGAA